MKYGYDMTHDEAAGAVETLRHRGRVMEILADLVQRLLRRGITHDQSKVKEPELKGFGEATKNLRTLTFGTPEYEAMIKKLQPLIDHHRQHSRHHPTFYPRGLRDMSLIDIMEMLADWKAAGERHDDGGDVAKSIKYNAERFGMGSILEEVLYNTAMDLGWLPSPTDDES